ncbi:flagellar hook-associated protein FlgK [Oceaniovalibus guishaninsula JLT2003]|uniref:Flagellar hook-associated protein 1 n=1 Tax=Oceaniovalibus guishaninsula JLT2003 TaxID=1231392 RepID=K2GPY5_9RHOB|nr:flagellar basal body rod C-terminal domain-containing protein [Oceaniovalibus guishaninsula]EKE44706.1 flagellar hook-associated protein FlgK [Oceaniovalibus guishaninsula JLT2003]
MSITSAMSNALSGLNAAGRQAQAVSSNVANALTPGYARREVQVSANAMGGVTAGRIDRRVDAAIVADRRTAEAELGNATLTTDALRRLADLTGAATDPNSLSGRVARFEGTLIEAASAPQSDTRLAAAVSAASELAATLNRASDGVQAERLRADTTIGRTVDDLRRGLERVAVLNREIARQTASGHDASTLHDQRQVVIDTLSAIAPLRELPRDHGRVALMTVAGQLLLDDRPVALEFTASNAMDPFAVPGTPLSTLKIDGREIDMTRPDGAMGGGSLAAAFDLRDRAGPDAQARLDVFAADLQARFVSLVPAGSPALFTDPGPASAAAPHRGMAQRIEVNNLVDPSRGGDAWRLRDGLTASAPGPAGDARLLDAMAKVMAQPRPDPVTSPTGLSRSLGAHADGVLSLAHGALFRAEDGQSFAAGRADALRQQEMELGVDTDQEMQSLLLIERTYGANARVLQAADAMLQRLMEI